MTGGLYNITVDDTRLVGVGRLVLVPDGSIVDESGKHVIYSPGGMFTPGELTAICTAFAM